MPGREGKSAGPGFPRTLVEFQERFATEAACLQYLIQIRWPEGFECPTCGSHGGWRIRRRTFRCRRCRQDVSVTAGTTLHDTHLPLRLWFWAAYLLSTLTPGLSARQLRRQLGLGSYETALFLCRRLRRAMVNPAREPLGGVVEVDDAYVGGPERGLRGGRQRGRKVLVGVAVENRGDHAGRVRLSVLPDVTQDTLGAFVARHVALGSQINTDGWDGYGGLERQGYQHRPRVQGPPERAGQILPWVHTVIGNLKTWLRGTHHGRVTRRHLPEYLEEFTFRFNRRRYPEHAFLTLLGLASRLPPAPRRSRRQVASSG